jgi:hypothetical protein
MKEYVVYIAFLFFVVFSCEQSEDVSIQQHNKVDVVDVSETFIRDTIFVPSDTTFIYEERRYRGKHLYIQNPRAGEGTGFCIITLEINGQIYDEIESNGLEIKLEDLGFELGDSLHIKISHRTDCQPCVLGHFSPGSYRATAEYTDVHIDGDTIFWTTENELNGFPFLVEQYRWNTWVNIGVVGGTGIPITNYYSFILDSCYHSGNNKFRIKQGSVHGNQISESISKVYNIKPIVFNTNYSEIGYLNFSTITHYQLLDEYENRVAKGYDDKVDLTDFEKGIYFLNYDTVQNVNITLF